MANRIISLKRVGFFVGGTEGPGRTGSRQACDREPAGTSEPTVIWCFAPRAVVCAKKSPPQSFRQKSEVLLSYCYIAVVNNSVHFSSPVAERG